MHLLREWGGLCLQARQARWSRAGEAPSWFGSQGRLELLCKSFAPLLAASRARFQGTARFTPVSILGGRALPGRSGSALMLAGSAAAGAVRAPAPLAPRPLHAPRRSLARTHAAPPRSSPRTGGRPPPTKRGSSSRPRPVGAQRKRRAMRRCRNSWPGAGRQRTRHAAAMRRCRNSAAATWRRGTAAQPPSPRAPPPGPGGSTRSRCPWQRTLARWLPAWPGAPAHPLAALRTAHTGSLQAAARRGAAWPEQLWTGSTQPSCHLPPAPPLCRMT